MSEVHDADLQITILGSNAAVPAHGRFPSGQLLKAGADFCLIDCGEGTQFRLKEYGLPSGKIRYIFISHLHGDHIFGLPPLITTWHLTGRTLPLDIWSPPGLEALVLDIFAVTGCEPSFPIKFHSIKSGHGHEILETTTLRVIAFELRHRSATLGYRFFRLMRNSGNKDQSNVTNVIFPVRQMASYAYCSDTAFYPEMATHLQGVDLLYHETTFLEEHAMKAISTGHSTAKEAAHIAQLSNAKGLVLGHFSARYKELDGFIAEAEAIFKPCFLAKEGALFHVTGY